MKHVTYTILILLLSLAACKQQENSADAYGNFEAIEVMVSAETSGRILSFPFQEGARLQLDQPAVVIDSTQLYLQKLRLESGFLSLSSRLSTLEAQVRASQIQLDNARREMDRVENLFEGGAATAKQMDDIKGQVDLLKAQIEATESQKASVDAERKTLRVQIMQVDDQIDRCTLSNPVEGILLTKYREQGEMAAPGQPLYKIANMDVLILRAYVSGVQLSSIKTGERVTVRIDGEAGLKELGGEVSWISPHAEFTPKIIQTREERVNLVYAIKVLVPNDGRLKIGMPGEVVFNQTPGCP